MTKQESDDTPSLRDRPANLPSESVIQVTAQMVEAGVVALRAEVGPGGDSRSTVPDFDSEIVTAVYRAMSSRHPGRG